MLRSTFLVISLIFGVLGVFAQKDEAPAAISLQPVLSGLTFPVYVTNAHDGTDRLFIIQKAGIIAVRQPGATTWTNFLDIRTLVSSSANERGLLGLAFHPQYTTNGRFFVYYTRLPDHAIQISEFHVSAGDPNVADTAETRLLTVPHPTNTNHNGGTVAFGMDGYLYAGTGDGGSQNDPNGNGQNINVLLGKMLRIDVNNVPAGQVPPYNIPPDNPYAGATPGADEIFAIGLRNPYRFSFDNGKQRGSQARSRLWVADVGQGSIEEVDLLKKGGNYGWRAYEGNSCTGLSPELCSNGATPIVHSPPIFQYSHTGGRCSITGGGIYRGRAGVMARGNYIYADYCTGEIFMWNGSTQVLLLDTARLIVAIGPDEEGEMYVVGQSGTLEKVIGTATTPPADDTADIIASRPERR